MMNKAIRPNKALFVLLLGPGLLWYVFAAILPTLNSLWYSLFSFKGFRVNQFIGLSNYWTLLQDETFWQSFKNNIIITALCVVGQIGIALIFASMLNTSYAKFKNLHRAVIFYPGILSTVVIGFVWAIMYNKDYGLIDFFLKKLGLSSLILPWLDDPKYVIYFVSLPVIWQYIGYYMVLIMAGMSNVTKEIYEMSDIDGASEWVKLTQITIPMIKDTLMVCLVLCISGNMQLFDHIYIMTGGGPGTSSMVMALYAYNKSFTEYRIDYGNTISVGILVLSLVIILIMRRLLGGKKVEQ